MEPITLGRVRVLCGDDARYYLDLYVSIDSGRMAFQMRSPFALLAVTLLGAFVAACGEASKRAGLSPRPSMAAGDASARRSSLAGAPQGHASIARSKLARPPWQSPVVHEPAYLNDGDHESPVDPDKDYVEDEDTDSRFHENSRYHDADDSGLVTYGQAASASVTRYVRAMVKHYYAMAAAGDGAGACADLVPHLARSAPADYGQLGPSYLRGSKTCGTVLVRLFKHSRIDFSAPLEVTDVRLNGNEGLALLGFKTLPPRSIAIEREQGAWWVAELLPQKMG